MRLKFSRPGAWKQLFSEKKQVCCTFASSANLTQRLSMKRLKYMSAAACAIHFFWKGLPAGDMLGHVHCMRIQDIERAFTRFTKVVGNAPRIILWMELFTGMI